MLVPVRLLTAFPRAHWDRRQPPLSQRCGIYPARGAKYGACVAWYPVTTAYRVLRVRNVLLPLTYPIPPGAAGLSCFGSVALRRPVRLSKVALNPLPGQCMGL